MTDETAAPTQVNIVEIVEKYIKLRDKRDAIKNEVKQKVATIEAAMAIAEGVLMDFFNKSGMDSAGCAAGTAFKTTRTSATVADWDSVIEYIKENEAWHMLEHRVSKKAIEEYVATEGDLPPGVNWSAETTINIRRS